MDAVYFVTSEGDEPMQLFFSAEEAFSSGRLYVDGFDEDGFLVSSFELNNDNRDLDLQTDESDYISIF